MADVNTLLARLRDLTHADPSPEQWAHIRATLDQAPAGDGRATCVAYAREHIASWPPEAFPCEVDDFIAGDLPWQALPTAASFDRACIINDNGVSRLRPPGWLTPLWASPRLAPLTALSLRFNLLTNADAADLAASPHPGHLTHLDLSHNNIGPEGVQALARSPHLARLTRLNLSSNPLGAEGAAARVAWLEAAPT